MFFSALRQVFRGCWMCATVVLRGFLFQGGFGSMYGWPSNARLACRIVERAISVRAPRNNYFCVRSLTGPVDAYAFVALICTSGGFWAQISPMALLSCEGFHVSGYCYPPRAHASVLRDMISCNPTCIVTTYFQFGTGFFEEKKRKLIFPFGP